MSSFFQNVGSSLSSILGIISMILVIYYPIKIYRKINYQYYVDKSCQADIRPFIEDSRAHSIHSVRYNMYFMLRRFLIVIVLVYLNNSPLIQTQIFTVFSLAHAMYLIEYRPMLTKRQWIVEIYDEVGVFYIHLYVLCYLRSIEQRKAKQTINTLQYLYRLYPNLFARYKDIQEEYTATLAYIDWIPQRNWLTLNNVDFSGYQEEIEFNGYIQKFNIKSKCLKKKAVKTLSAYDIIKVKSKMNKQRKHTALTQQPDKNLQEAIEKKIEPVDHQTELAHIDEQEKKIEINKPSIEVLQNPDLFKIEKESSQSSSSNEDMINQLSQNEVCVPTTSVLRRKSTLEKTQSIWIQENEEEQKVAQSKSQQQKDYESTLKIIKQHEDQKQIKIIISEGQVQESPVQLFTEERINLANSTVDKNIKSRPSVDKHNQTINKIRKQFKQCKDEQSMKEHKGFIINQIEKDKIQHLGNQIDQIIDDIIKKRQKKKQREEKDQFKLYHMRKTFMNLSDVGLIDEVRNKLIGQLDEKQRAKWSVKIHDISEDVKLSKIKQMNDELEMEFQDEGGEQMNEKQKK